MKSFKRIRENIRRILTTQRWVAVAFGVVVLYLIGVFWYGTLHNAPQNEDSVRYQNESRRRTEMREVCYYEDGAYLLDGDGKVIAGPYQYIAEDWKQEDADTLQEKEESESRLTRYLGENGYYGYLDVEDGRIVLQPVYREAGAMVRGYEQEKAQALVYDGEEYYCIDSRGKRITEGHYLQWIPRQNGFFCAKLADTGTWALLDQEENVLLEGCQYIGVPEEDSIYGYALRDGKLLLLRAVLLKDSGRSSCEIVAEYENFSKIVFYEEQGFALIKNADGLFGAISLEDGEVLLKDQYTAVTCDTVQTHISDTERGKLVQFTAQKKDGTSEVVNWKAED